MGGGRRCRPSIPYGVRMMPLTPLSAQGRAPAMMEAGGGGKGSGRSRLGRQVGVYLARQGAFSVRSGWCAGGRGQEGGRWTCSRQGVLRSYGGFHSTIFSLF